MHISTGARKSSRIMKTKGVVRRTTGMKMMKMMMRRMNDGDDEDDHDTYGWG